MVSPSNKSNIAPVQTLDIYLNQDVTSKLNPNVLRIVNAILDKNNNEKTHLSEIDPKAVNTSVSFNILERSSQAVSTRTSLYPLNLAALRGLAGIVDQLLPLSDEKVFKKHFSFELEAIRRSTATFCPPSSIDCNFIISGYAASIPSIVGTWYETTLSNWEQFSTFGNQNEARRGFRKFYQRIREETQTLLINSVPVKALAQLIFDYVVVEPQRAIKVT